LLRLAGGALSPLTPDNDQYSNVVHQADSHSEGQLFYYPMQDNHQKGDRYGKQRVRHHQQQNYGTFGGWDHPLEKTLAQQYFHAEEPCQQERIPGSKSIPPRLPALWVAVLVDVQTG
jgi:hypothetical protein